MGKAQLTWPKHFNQFTICVTNTDYICEKNSDVPDDISIKLLACCLRGNE